MLHPSADSSWFTFEAPSAGGFRVYAFTGTEEVHKPYEFDIELVHESANADFASLLGQPACLSIADKSGGVRHSQGWAGGQFGALAIPRIGQEVLVTFLTEETIATKVHGCDVRIFPGQIHDTVSIEEREAEQAELLALKAHHESSDLQDLFEARRLMTQDRAADTDALLPDPTTPTRTRAT